MASDREGSMDGMARAELAWLERQGLLRTRRTRATAGARIVLDGREVTNFCSNDYLGLAASPVLAAAAAAERSTGYGATASRLVVGNTSVHQELEQALSAWGKRSALLFNSGFAANTGIIPALVGRGDVIFSDELNHASLIDGCRLSGAKVVVYRHLDVEHLRECVEQHPGHRRLLVTESLFSMDGDLAPLAELAEVAGASGVWLMVDEAHALGIVGPQGRGLAAALGVAPDVTVGTLGKAMGTFGAFSWSSESVRDLFWNRCRPLVFSTGLPPSVAAASLAALQLLSGESGESLRRQLFDRVMAVRQGLAELGLVVPGSGPILPILVGSPAATMSCSAALLEEGLFVQGIRPPTVPAGTARLRVTVSAAHSEEETSSLVRGIGRLIARGKLVPRGT